MLATPRTPSVPNFSTMRRASDRGPGDQRLEYCGALRAFLRPYFLDSFFRGSRRQEAFVLQLATALGVELGEGTGEAEAHGAGLTGDAATLDAGVDVVVLGGLGDDQRGEGQAALGLGREVDLRRPCR